MKKFWDRWKKNSNYQACNGFERTKKQYENNCNRGSMNDCDMFWLQVEIINSNCKDTYKTMNQERKVKKINIKTKDSKTVNESFLKKLNIFIIIIKKVFKFLMPKLIY